MNMFLIISYSSLLVRMFQRGCAQFDLEVRNYLPNGCASLRELEWLDWGFSYGFACFDDSCPNDSPTKWLDELIELFHMNARISIILKYFLS